MLGYDRIPVREDISIGLVPPSSEAITLSDIRSTLIGSGYFESISVSFVSDNLIEHFCPGQAAALLRPRRWCGRTTHTFGRAYCRDCWRRFGGTKAWGRRRRSYSRSARRSGWVQRARWMSGRRLGLMGSGDLHEVRGAVETLLGRLNADLPVAIVPDRRAGFAAGACGRIEWGGGCGALGMVDRGVVGGAVAARTARRRRSWSYQRCWTEHGTCRSCIPLPRFPAVRRDLSLVVAEGVAYEQIVATLRGIESGGPGGFGVRHDVPGQAAGEGRQERDGDAGLPIGHDDADQRAGGSRRWSVRWRRRRMRLGATLRV